MAFQLGFLGMILVGVLGILVIIGVVTYRCTHPERFETIPLNLIVIRIDESRVQGFDCLNPDGAHSVCIPV